MDVKTVCLGMLTDGAASGYDLKKQFESTFGHFFAAGYGSIYPALSSLADQGLVTCERVAQEGKPDRKVYAITGSGKEFLLEALKDPAPCHKVRSDFLATLCFAHLMPTEQIETVLKSRLADADNWLKLIAEAQACCFDEWPPGLKFVAGFGRAMTLTMKQYVEENGHMLTQTGNHEVANG